MHDLSKRFRLFLIGLPRWVKRLLLVSADFCILSIALWAAFSLRLSRFYIPVREDIIYLTVLAPLLGIATFWARGLYRIVTRYIGQEAATHIYLTIAFSVLLWALVVFLSGVPGVPRSVVIIYGLLAAGLIRLSRHYAAWILKAEPLATPASLDKTNVLIYGAGSTGLQLLQALRNSGEYRPVGFVDVDKTLWGQTIQKMRVYRPEKIEKLIARNNVKEIFLALSSRPLSERRGVIRSLESLPVVVKTLPALEDIASGKVRVSDLRPIDVEDLLGRDPVKPDTSLLSRNISGKSVMITGAGGSIGSELTRQVLLLRPTKLILFELSEIALYEIEAQTRQILAEMESDGETDGGTKPTEIVAVLGSVLDQLHVERTLEKYRVETIYHAAAYKHVPIVEENPGTGLHNNTYGTLTVAEAALACGVERMVLISTDKAVRPTNVMGASKRLAELVLQAMADDGGKGTVFTMVRFGNVLDSSGSVVRRFRKQIEAGGPVTVTHPDITRYFMSIPEAAQLVIQAGAMATGGEVFVLDMGQPVKIDDLARTMIHLSGLTPRDETNPEGDIAIDYVGLRLGEKLYEELLIGENSTGTTHSRILKNNEPYLSLDELKKELSVLMDAIKANDADAMEAILKRTVEGYTGSLPVPDIAAEESGVTEDWQIASRTLH